MQPSEFHELSTEGGNPKRINDAGKPFKKFEWEDFWLGGKMQDNSEGVKKIFATEMRLNTT